MLSQVRYAGAGSYSHGTDDDGSDSDRTRRLSSVDREESFLRRKDDGTAKIEKDKQSI